jgi:hypothetical protein
MNFLGMFNCLILFLAQDSIGQRFVGIKSTNNSFLKIELIV